MHIDKVGAKIDEITKLWAEVKECNISKKVASAEEKAEMREKEEFILGKLGITRE